MNMRRKNVLSELTDAIEDFLEHAENGGETEVWAGINLDDIRGLQNMIEKSEMFLPEDWNLAKRLLEYRVENLEEIANGNVHTASDAAYFEHEINHVKAAIAAIG